MTPLELSILLHYRGAMTDFRDGDFSAPAVREAIDWFRDTAGMLVKTNGDPHDCAAYRLTAKGEFFVDQLCAMPLPVRIYVMPPVDPQPACHHKPAPGEVRRWNEGAGQVQCNQCKEWIPLCLERAKNATPT